MQPCTASMPFSLIFWMSVMAQAAAGLYAGMGPLPAATAQQQSLTTVLCTQGGLSTIISLCPGAVRTGTSCVRAVSAHGAPAKP